MLTIKSNYIATHLKMDRQTVFVDSTMFLLQHSRQLLSDKNNWDTAADRFRQAWSDPGYSIAERVKIFADFYTEHRLQLFSDGYSWIANDKVTLAMSFVDDRTNQRKLYGSIKLGSCFQQLQLEKTEARLEENAETEKLILEKEMQLYKSLLTACGATLNDAREIQLLQKILADYNNSGADEPNPMLDKMMGSAGGLFDLVLNATDGNESIPPQVRNTLQNLKGKMANGGASGPEGMIGMIQDTFSSGELGGLFAAMKGQTGGNPMFDNILSMMSSNVPLEEKAIQITEITSDPAMLDELKRQMAE